jgi:hypothetical protein
MAVSPSVSMLATTLKAYTRQSNCFTASSSIIVYVNGYAGGKHGSY